MFVVGEWMVRPRVILVAHPVSHPIHPSYHPAPDPRTHLRLGRELVREQQPDERLGRGLALARGALGRGELLLELRDAVPAEADALVVWWWLAAG